MRKRGRLEILFPWVTLIKSRCTKTACLFRPAGKWRVHTGQMAPPAPPAGLSESSRVDSGGGQGPSASGARRVSPVVRFLLRPLPFPSSSPSHFLPARSLPSQPPQSLSEPQERPQKGLVYQGTVQEVTRPAGAHKGMLDVIMLPSMRRGRVRDARARRRTAAQAPLAAARNASPKPLT